MLLRKIIDWYLVSLKNDIKTATEDLLKKEQELNVSRLTLEETRKEKEEKYTKYEELKKSFLGKH